MLSHHKAVFSDGDILNRLVLVWDTKIEGNLPTLEHLFNQLGLDSSESGIQEFIANHTLKRGEPLENAEFWTRSQSEFLRECWQMDADWVGAIEQLNIALHR